MDELIEKVEKYLRDEISCLYCSGEFCNGDGTHDEKKRKEVATELIKIINPSLVAGANN